MTVMLFTNRAKPVGKTVDLDSGRRRQIRQYKRAMTEGESTLASVSKETGGDISGYPNHCIQIMNDATRWERIEPRNEALIQCALITSLNLEVEAV